PLIIDEGERRALRQTLQLPTDAFLLGFVGRLVEEKGIQTVLSALREARDPNMVLLLVGDGPYRPDLEEMVASYGIGNQVIFRPSVPSHEVIPVFKTLDSLVLPSLTRSNWKEQFGRVLVEAMAAG